MNSAEEINLRFNKISSSHGYNLNNITSVNTAVVEMNDIIQAFDSFSFEITSHQRDVIHRYWGLNQLKSPEEIENFITS